MIIEKREYKRNKKGDIIQHQEVLVKCDQCGLEWSTLYQYRLRKKNDNDLCLKCRSKQRFKNGKTDHSSQIVKCNQCGKIFRKFVAHMLSDVNYCCKKCRDDAHLNRYKHLYNTFEQYPDELAYLCGLILGDGCLQKQQKRTTKIIIAFDVKYPKVLSYAVDIINTLQIPFHQNQSIHKNCISISFSLPDDLLHKYNMLWSGNKFNVQPKPTDTIVNNINFAGGLINSDGSIGNNKKYNTYECIRFNNTCQSIIECLKQSLIRNDISYNEYTYDPIIHKRTGNMQKRSYIVIIGKRDDVANMHKLLPFLKEKQK